MIHACQANTRPILEVVTLVNVIYGVVKMYMVI
jgi:hypothetical protein